MDINAPDFAESFSKEDAVVGIIGQGFVGGAMKAYFDRHHVSVLAYDKHKPTGTKLEQVIERSDVVFVCVPTPMRPSGECYTGIVESVLDDIRATADLVGRPQHTFIVCVKSTVPPGFTDAQRFKRPNMRLVFSPEFLTEKNAVGDMLNANRIVVGGDADDVRVVLQFFLEADRGRVQQGDCALVECSAAAAEMAKLFANGLLFMKVLFCNEIFALCKRLGIEYEEVKEIVALDQRIGPSHMQVPGPDGFMGAGGSCFPKDLNNLMFVARQHGIDERLFTAVWKRNQEVREKCDWKELEGRAVIDR